MEHRLTCIGHRLSSSFLHAPSSSHLGSTCLDIPYLTIPPFDGGGPTRDASLSASAECTHPVILVASIHCLLYTLTFLSAQSMFNGQDINGRCRT